MIRIDEENMPGSTWNKTDAREPVFVLVGRDRLAPILVRMWVTLARFMGVKAKKLQEAAELASQMEAWQDINGSKIPD